ncbi:MAG: 50S ribosomal protein L15 [Clostridia bacterium]|nr:50S ribosomal protein L15 [Clostridia bacterium]
MNIQSLKPAENSRFSQKRLGRGIGSGLGKTSGKGHKGQNARSGGGVRIGFEGGQMPLIRKLPRRGFNNYNFKKQYSIVNLSELNKFDENAVVDCNSLIEKGILSKIAEYGVKILGNGKLEKALTVKASKFSATAVEKIKKAGGTIEEV